MRRIGSEKKLPQAEPCWYHTLTTLTSASSPGTCTLTITWSTSLKPKRTNEAPSYSSFAISARTGPVKSPSSGKSAGVRLMPLVASTAATANGASFQYAFSRKASTFFRFSARTAGSTGYAVSAVAASESAAARPKIRCFMSFSLGENYGYYTKCAQGAGVQSSPKLSRERTRERNRV